MAHSGKPPVAVPPALPPVGPALNAPGPSNYMENGRMYEGFRKGKYMFPNDEVPQEMDRMDIYHKLFSVARRDALHSTPFIPNYDRGPRILDLGTGTGIWAIGMADQYQHAEVLGVDLSLIQPPLIPVNTSFQQRDIESPWHGMELDSWDLIHMRMLNGSIQSWAGLYQQIFRHLKPGFGWLEHVEIDITPRCDDNTLPANCALVNWANCLIDATARACRPIAYNTETGATLKMTGFVEIQEQIFKVPLNPWPNDLHLKDIGKWYNLGLTQGLEAFTLGPMTRVMNWTKGDVDRLVVEAKKDICSQKYHTFCNMHIWIARRPAKA